MFGCRVSKAAHSPGVVNKHEQAHEGRWMSILLPSAGFFGPEQASKRVLNE
jgi:hypothetical protein